MNPREISGFEVGSSVKVTDAVQWGLLLEQNKDEPVDAYLWFRGQIWDHLHSYI